MEDRLIILQPSKAGPGGVAREVVYEPHPLPCRAYRFWLNPDPANFSTDSLWVYDGQQLQVFVADASRWLHAFDVLLGFEPLRVNPKDGTVIGLGSQTLKAVDLSTISNAQRVAVSG